MQSTITTHPSFRSGLFDAKVPALLLATSLLLGGCVTAPPEEPVVRAIPPRSRLVASSSAGTFASNKPERNDGWVVIVDCMDSLVRSQSPVASA